jgi:hypothetical protein
MDALIDQLIPFYTGTILLLIAFTFQRERNHVPLKRVYEFKRREPEKAKAKENVYDRASDINWKERFNGSFEAHFDSMNGLEGWLEFCGAPWVKRKAAMRMKPNFFREHYIKDGIYLLTRILGKEWRSPNIRWDWDNGPKIANDEASAEPVLNYYKPDNDKLKCSVWWDEENFSLVEQISANETRGNSSARDYRLTITLLPDGNLSGQNVGTSVSSGAKTEFSWQLRRLDEDECPGGHMRKM